MRAGAPNVKLLIEGVPPAEPFPIVDAAGNLDGFAANELGLRRVDEFAMAQGFPFQVRETVKMRMRWRPPRAKS